jgi:IS605 OrfB family transposase
MNKCIKITIKNCINIDKYRQVLRDLRYQTWLASNKAMTNYYTFALENMEYKNINGININEKERYGKSYDAWIQNRMNEIMTMHQSGNVAQTAQFVAKRFKDDIKKGMFKGKISISNFKQDIPLIIHNKNYKIIQGDKGYKIECSLFNREYQKENIIKKAEFQIDKIDNNCKSVLNRIISGEYKQGSMQITEDKKGKWYFIISYSFEASKQTFDQNRILGIDLGITKVATMQIFDKTIEEWDRLSWKECMMDGRELIHYRQKIEARKKQLQIASKWCGEGRVGHGTKTRMKPLDKIGSVVSNFKDTYNHKISRYIIDFAIKHNCGIIQMEDLSGFSEQQTESLLKNWSYFDLQTKIKYKAEEKGVEVIFINPQYTSKRCSRCGCIDTRNRDCENNQSKFECVTCGHKENADINAAKNISMPDIEEIIGEYIKYGLKVS